MEKSHMCLPVTFDWLTSKCFRNLFKKLEHCSNRVNLFPKQKFWILLVIHQKLLFRKLVSEALFRKLSLVYQGLKTVCFLRIRRTKAIINLKELQGVQKHPKALR